MTSRTPASRRRATSSSIDASGRDLLQIAFGSLIDLVATMQHAADHNDIIEFVWIQKAAGWAGHDAAAGAHGVRAAGHDRPLRTHRTAAVAIIGRKAQMVDKQGKGGEGKVIGQDDADPQRRALRWLGVGHLVQVLRHMLN